MNSGMTITTKTQIASTVWMGDIQFGGTHFILAVTPPLMAATLVKDYPQVEASVPFVITGGYW
jgi:hypothetical protein